MAIKYSPLYLKNFEVHKILALKENNNNFDSWIKIPVNLWKNELLWWKNKIRNSGNPIKDFNFKLEIFPDSSKSGWGAHCNLESTRGFWKSEAREKHINFLELKAAFFALHCFVKDLKNCDILLRLHNKTAISYINRMGGTHVETLNDLAVEIWKWCEKRGLWIYASYITSKDNALADLESRTLEPETEYELSCSYFNKIKLSFGNPEIDLFASRTNKKCPRYISWLKDPFAYKVDAFTIKWREFYFYAIPPFSIILKVLKKINMEKSTGIMVVPFWPTQPWYPLFKKMLISKPLYFNPDKYLLISSNTCPHPLWKQLTLVAGKPPGLHID